MKLSEFLVGTLVVIVVILVTIGIWKMKKHMNYNLMYKGMVEQTVRDMVKSEALK